MNASTTDSDHPGETQPKDPNELPFVAPCRKLAPSAPFRWLRSGWRDFLAAAPQSIVFGLVVVAASYLAAFIAYRLGGVALLLSALSGFLLLGPVIALGVYELSRQLRRGETPDLVAACRMTRRHFGNELVFTIALLVVFLVWARAASMVHVFFPVQADPGWRELALFLSVGSAVGAIFAAIVFSVAAFSLPMIADRHTDAVTAIVTSVNAVLRNKAAMLVWAIIVMVSIFIGFATAFLGLAVLMPLIGHATWHAYLDTVDAGAWPVIRPERA